MLLLSLSISALFLPLFLYSLQGMDSLRPWRRTKLRRTKESK
ncbi:unnamed protein product [Brassica oleracea]